MNFPVIPDNLSEITSIEQLNELVAEFRTRAREVLAQRREDPSTVSDELWDAASAAPEAIATLRDRIAQLRADAEAEAAIDALDDDEDDEDESESDDDEDGEADGDEDESEDDGEDEDGEDEDGEADGDADEAPVPVGAGALHDQAPGSRSRPITTNRPGNFTFVSGVDGHEAGDPVTDLIALSEAMRKRYMDIQGGSTEKIAVAQLKAHFTEEMERPIEGVSFDWYDPDAITAGLTCVPREPIYDVGCASSTARPVMGSLPTKRAPRGGFSVYPSPTMADVTDRQDEITGEGDPEDNGDGTGIWTRENDGDLQAVKEACAVIPCGTPENFDVYGVYRCITVRNLLQLTFPELVAAYLNKLGALWARLADTALLDGMVNSPWSIDVTDDVTGNNLGATATLLDRLVQIARVYTEQDRYMEGLRFGVWLHRWVATLVIRDWLKAPRYNPTFSELIAVQSEINAAFSRAGFNVHWTMDAATAWASIDQQVDGEALVDLPTRVDMKIAPEPNFMRLDLGNMTVGVTNRNPWDKDDMARNQFTMFWESYEGIIDNGCPSWNYSVDPLCDSGLMHFTPGDAPECVSTSTGD